MPTVVLDVYSKAYPFISNRIRAAVLEETTAAVVDSIIDVTPSHPARSWHFPGLPRRNYRFSLDEIDGGGLVVNNLALFDVVPGTLDSLAYREDEQIKVDVTPGLVSNTNTFTFDGTETFVGSGIFKPNYIDWNIIPSELTGRGILVKGQDYSWNKTTGVFTLLIPFDKFFPSAWWNIAFSPQQNPAGNSVPSINDFNVIKFTTNDSILSSMFGDKIIAEPAGDYIELLLPDINTVVIGRKVMIEFSGSSLKCVKVYSQLAQEIKFLNQGLPYELYGISGESLSIYRYDRTGVGPEWRVFEDSGNFRNVGMISSEDLVASSVINKQLLDGFSASVLKYARIYNTIISRLPGTQVCNYDDWGTGNNKYLYSLANSANPSNANKFRFPDRRGLFERSNLAGKAGDYYADTVVSHLHETAFARDNNGVSPGTGSGVWTDAAPGVTFGKISTKAFGGTETAPKHYLINKFVIL